MNVKEFISGLTLALIFFSISYSNILLGTLKDAKLHRSPSAYCKIEQESCRVNSDCCSHNCEAGLCGRRISTKGENGEPCRSDFNCRSGLCHPRYQRCSPTLDYPSAVGGYCDGYGSNCVSQFCDNQRMICRGSVSKKALVGQFCGSNFECQSDYCSSQWNICLGSSKDPGRYWELCTGHEQCESGYCESKYSRCM